jgi:hypothetical protein
VQQNKRDWTTKDNDGHVEVVRSQPVSTVHTLWRVTLHYTYERQGMSCLD